MIIGVMRPGEVMQNVPGYPMSSSFYRNFIAVRCNEALGSNGKCAEARGSNGNCTWNPLMSEFFEHFTQRKGSVQYNNSVNCCLYYSSSGICWSSDWGEGATVEEKWDGMEGVSNGSYKVGMLLDLDGGTLSVYKNGRKLGVMKRGLAGQYCWVVSLAVGTQVTIKRGTVPAS